MVSSARRCKQLVNFSRFLDFFKYLSFIQKMLLFGKIVVLPLLLGSPELCREDILNGVSSSSSCFPSFKAPVNDSLMT